MCRKTTSMTTVPPLTVKRVTRYSKTIRHPRMHRVYTRFAELPHPTIHREIKNLLGGGRLGNARYLWAERSSALRPPANGRALS